MNKRTTLILNILFFVIQVAICIGFIIKKEYTFIFNPLSTSIFFIGIILIEKFTSFRLKNYIRILLIITITSHNFIGEFLKAYENLPGFDKTSHLFGNFSFALLIYAMLIYFFNIRTAHPVLFCFILLVLISFATGTFFELIEFALDLITKDKNQGGLIDTDLDLVFDMIGGIFAGAWAAYLEAKNRSNGLGL